MVNVHTIGLKLSLKFTISTISPLCLASVLQLSFVSVRVFDSASRPNVAPGRGSSQWSSQCERNDKEVEVGVRVECAEDVTTMTARAT